MAAEIKTRFLSAVQVKKYLNVSESGLRHYIAAGLPVTRLPGKGRARYFDIELIDKFMARLTKKQRG
jgi:hypothetical protein